MKFLIIYLSHSILQLKIGDNLIWNLTNNPSLICSYFLNNSDYFFLNPLTIFAQGTESLIGIFSARFPYSPIQL